MTDEKLNSYCCIIISKTRRQLHKNVASNIEQVLAATPHKTPASHHENYPS